MTVKKRKAKKDASQSRELTSLVKDAARLDAELAKDLVRQPMRFGVLRSAPENDLGVRIQQARQFAGLTQEQLAAKTRHADEDNRGISAAVISLYERGVNRPGPKEIRLLCEALRVEPNVFIYGDEDPFDQRSDANRYSGWAASEPEFLAILTYCFSRLHHHHREAILQLMLGLLRGWNDNFDADLHDHSSEALLKTAAELKKLLDSRAVKKP